MADAQADPRDIGVPSEREALRLSAMIPDAAGDVEFEVFQRWTDTEPPRKINTLGEAAGVSGTRKRRTIRIIASEWVDAPEPDVSGSHDSARTSAKHFGGTGD